MGRLATARGSILIPVVALVVGVSVRHWALRTSTPQSSPAAVATNSYPVTNASQTLPAERLFALASPAVVQVTVYDSRKTPTAFGSGFFISPDGLLVTNFHVIRRAASATVKVSGRGEYVVAGAAAVNPEADLAILKIDGTNLPFLKLNDDQLPKVGTKVYALGNPEGLTNTLSEGLVSGLRAPERGVTWIQTSAPISHGSSGGPLLAMDGSVLGVTSASYVSGQSLNFAVPANQVSRLLDSRDQMLPLQVASIDPRDPDDKRALDDVESAIRSGRLREAGQHLAEIQDRQHNNPNFWYSAGHLAFILRDYAVADTNLRRSIRLRSDYAPAWLMLGYCLENQNKYREALDAFASAAKVRPNDYRAPSGAGEAWTHLGNDTEAVQCFNQAIRLNPKDVTSYRLLGSAYFRLTQYGAAANAFAALVRLDPASAIGHIGLGDAQFNIGEYRQAKAEYQRVIELDANNAYAWLSLGACNYGLNDPTGASEAWQQASNLDPVGRFGAAARKNLAAASNNH